MEAKDIIFLSESNLASFIGKKIQWRAPSAQEEPYTGVAIIKAVDLSKHRPLTVETISGDDLSYAFLDDHGMEYNADKGWWTCCRENRVLSYSDGYREVTVDNIIDDED